MGKPARPWTLPGLLEDPRLELPPVLPGVDEIPRTAVLPAPPLAALELVGAVEFSLCLSSAAGLLTQNRNQSEQYR